MTTALSEIRSAIDQLDHEIVALIAQRQAYVIRAGELKRGEPSDAVRAVLEFANVELLEMRMLDEQLDQALDQGYEALTRTPRPLSLPGSYDKHTTHIAQLQVDGALLFDGNGIAAGELLTIHGDFAFGHVQPGVAA